MIYMLRESVERHEVVRSRVSGVAIKFVTRTWRRLLRVGSVGNLVYLHFLFSSRKFFFAPETQLSHVTTLNSAAKRVFTKWHPMELT